MALSRLIFWRRGGGGASSSSVCAGFPPSCVCIAPNCMLAGFSYSCTCAGCFGKLHVRRLHAEPSCLQVFRRSAFAQGFGGLHLCSFRVEPSFVAGFVSSSLCAFVTRSRVLGVFARAAFEHLLFWGVGAGERRDFPSFVWRCLLRDSCRAAMLCRV